MGETAPDDEDLLPDRDHLAELLESLSAEELRDLYRQFAARARADAALLGADPATLTARQLEERVHDLKGTAANLALKALSAGAARVLVALRHQGLAEAVRESAALVRLIERVTSLLESDQLDRRLASP
jgi:HPt (histidine-containing phosphotransfer) domain-containing protein